MPRLGSPHKIVNNTDHKLCPSCSTFKPTTEFNRYCKAGDGLAYHCRQCNKIKRQTFTESSLDKSKTYTCATCSKQFIRARQVSAYVSKHSTKHPKFCSHQCYWESIKTIQPVNCITCNQSYKPSPSSHSKYCSRRCFRIALPAKCHQCLSGIHPDDAKIKYKTYRFCNLQCKELYIKLSQHYGVSKLERWIQTQLLLLYPTIHFEFNQRAAINGELDIYIPSLNLAFELNGPFHYEPIYGPEKLKNVQNNDNRKFQACLEQGIELCIIDTSKQRKASIKTSQPYLGIICNLINEKL